MIDKWCVDAAVSGLAGGIHPAPAPSPMDWGKGERKVGGSDNRAENQSTAVVIELDDAVRVLSTARGKWLSITVGGSQLDWLLM